MIRFEQVSVTYEGAAGPSLQGVDLVIPEGELTLLVGPSGVGKSTLLGAVSGLVPHFTGGTLRGRVTVAGRDTRTHKPRELADVVGTVGQDPLAHFVTDVVEDELAYGMESLGLPPAVMRRRVEETLDLLGLNELRDRPIATLSGGQQQRVAIGSVLTPHPRVLVLDEPTSALDPAAAEEVLAVVQRLVHDLGTTVLMAEHRLERVVQYADRVLLLPGPGAVPLLGSPAEIMAVSPVHPPVVALGRLAGWSPLPLSIRDARRLAAPLRSRLSPPAGDHAPSARANPTHHLSAPDHPTASQGSALAGPDSPPSAPDRAAASEGSALAGPDSPPSAPDRAAASQGSAPDPAPQTPARLDVAPSMPDCSAPSQGSAAAHVPLLGDSAVRGGLRGTNPASPAFEARGSGGRPPAAAGRTHTGRPGGWFARLLGRGTPRPEPAPAEAGEMAAELRNLGVRRGRVEVLHGVTLAVAPGETVALMGRNGAGKSTLLAAMVGTVPPATGSVTVGGATPHRTAPAEMVRRVGLVPQEPRDLLYADTVAAECAAADSDAGAASGTCRDLVSALLPDVPDDTHPRDLSEGQRLALALALVLTGRPALLLLDEPTRGLDYAAKARLVEILRALAADGHAIVLATHDVELAAELAHRVVILAGGEVVADGPTAEVVVSSPAFAPQVAKILAPGHWLTVTQVTEALS
ncbi:ABC transporter ATP-binding protein [Streptomyces sp. ISL-94]|uniref:ABC transporter ATP-binding protein n=1 Tax=Streptomyces sp. ISL-94 TaxID=2819190 RepID=UPI001BE5A42F|nr:ABC transporter ATP-binding protein [Streptomyces sp. ISL-94]MBT2479819.1 ATP-binding cassette domain-containing protein [Streptomyces sp. ISL-94]